MPTYSGYFRNDDEARKQVGKMLLDARKGLGKKQLEVANAAGTTPTTVSLVERGERAVSPPLLEKLVAASGADATAVFRITGTVPPAVAEDLLAPELAEAIERGRLDADVRWELRKPHLEEIAGKLTARMTAAPIQLKRMLKAEFELSCQPVPGLPWPRFGTLGVEHGDAVERVELQRQLAHMAGHALLAREANRRPACHRGEPVDEEQDADWLAGLIAMPRPLLRRRFQGKVGDFQSHFKDHQPAGGERVEDAVLRSAAADVASEFAVPVWMAMRHIAAEGLLEWAFGGSA